MVWHARSSLWAISSPLDNTRAVVFRSGGEQRVRCWACQLTWRGRHKHASEALEVIKEAEALIERFELRWWSAELHRLRGVFLATMGAEETQIAASFREAIRIAKEQKSISLEKRAEATYAEYRRQKANASGGRGIRLPLW
jgi:hypothetical protein